MRPEQLISAALRGESAAWPAESPSALQQKTVDTAAEHGVLPLLSTSPAVAWWPDSLRSAVAASLRAEVAIETLRRDLLVSVLTELSRAGVRALVLKGAHLAYTHYPKPWLRPRLDTDILVAAEQRVRAGAVLQDLGYRPGNHYDGDLVTHQFRYDRQGRHGLTDAIDLHWKIANPHLFANALTFEELEAEAGSIDGLGPHARGPSDVHALLLACIHRVAHHDNSDRLIWLYDIHLLTHALTPSTGDSLVQLATRKRLRAVCASGGERAHSRFAGGVTPGWLAQLASDGHSNEPSAGFLAAGRSKADTFVSDLRTLDRWPHRARLIAEHLFPPAAYIRQAYGLDSPLLLPFCYAHRVAFGMGRWFHRSHGAP